jgi:uncharacterized membrane protein (DUF4010 family)
MVTRQLITHWRGGGLLLILLASLPRELSLYHQGTAKFDDGSFGGSGVYWASFFSGLTDLDAISLSLAQLERAGNATSAEAARGLLIAAGANSLLKGAIAISLGSPAMRRPILIVLGGTVALSALAAVLI